MSEEQILDEFHGKGGCFEIRDGKRVRVAHATKPPPKPLAAKGSQAPSPEAVSTTDQPAQAAATAKVTSKAKKR